MKITVFTPTYNRAHLLPRLIQSLKEQTDQEFEWIIVDDGSTDDTEKIIKSLSLHIFELNYHKQEHGGKHRAINWAVSHAKGQYMIIVDSDDWLIKDAVKLIKVWLDKLQNDRVKNVCGVAGLKITSKNVICGGEPISKKGDYIEATNIERSKKNLLGDKAEVYSVEILKKYPFPEFSGEYFLTEAVVWNKIAADGYKIRWYNEPIYYCEYLDDGLTKSGANDRKGHLENFNGFALYTRQLLKYFEFKEVINDFWEYNTVCNILRVSIKKRIQLLDVSFFKYMCLFSVTILFKIKNKIMHFLIRDI